MLLQGLKVVEMATWVAGPSAAAVLADWGADVIKVESPIGDATRAFQPDTAESPGNPIFTNENRGKKGVVLDISRPEGRKALKTLLSQADWVGLFSTPVAASDMGGVKDYVHNGGVLVVAGSAVADLLAKLHAAGAAIPGLDPVERDGRAQSPAVRSFGKGRMIFSAPDSPEALRGFPIEGGPGRPAAWRRPGRSETQTGVAA